MMDVSRSQEHLRILAVQTRSLLDPEMSVFCTLLENLQHLAQEKNIRAEVLLFQGVDAYVDSAVGRPVAPLFNCVPNVTVHEMQVGKLGRKDTPALDRVMKVRDLVNMQRTRKQLLAVAQSFRPDLVYSSEERWDVRLATSLARSLRRPQVIHLHIAVAPWLGRGTLSALRQTDMVIAVSAFVRDRAIRCGVQGNRVHVLYNSAVPPRELSLLESVEAKRRLCAELSIPEDSLLVGMIARLSPYKGQVELVQAMLPILAGDQQVHVILVGREDPAGHRVPERIHQHARTCGVLSQVHLLGPRSDVPRLLDALDVFAHPSRDEALGLAVLEAASHGLPVVAWRDGGMPEVVISGQTGLLVEPMNIEELTRALRTLIRDQDMRMKMGSKARERAAHTFSPDIAAATFLSLLQTAARGTGATAQVS